MDAGRPLTDSALDREIQAALAVHPSPEFLARVRQRVAAEPPDVRWGSRRLAGFAAAALDIHQMLLVFGAQAIEQIGMNDHLYLVHGVLILAHHGMQDALKLDTQTVSNIIYNLI